MKYVPVGNPLPVEVQLGEGLDDLYVRAWLLAADGTELEQVDLTHQGNGLYSNTSLVMPEAQVAYLQSIAYVDSGYTIPYDGNVETVLFMSVPSLEVQAAIPSWAQLGILDVGFFPLATILDADGNAISGSPFALSHVIRGLYLSNDALMPVTAYATVQIQVFTDSGHTDPADFYISANTYPGDPDGSETPSCPDPDFTVDGFKAWFWRDFPYGVTPSSVTNQDIKKALDQAACAVNTQLFCSEGQKNQGLLLAAAHFLVSNLRASSQGIGGKMPWLTQSKGVGSVNESYAIPQRILDNVVMAGYATTSYGSQYLLMVSPCLVGQIFTVAGRTRP